MGLPLNNEDKEQLQKFYSQNLLKFGENSASSLGWINRHNQNERFEILTKIGELSRKSILDFGCGLGDLYWFIKTKYLDEGNDINYTGLDIVPNFIEIAKLRYPNQKFILGELSNIDTTFDYILASGSLTYNIPNGKEYYFELIKSLYQRSNIGLAFNMLNSDYSPSDNLYLTYSPNEVLEFCKTFSKDVKIILGYLPDDFTVYLYK